MSTPEDIQEDARDEDASKKYEAIRDEIAKNYGMKVGERDGDAVFTGTIEEWENFKAGLEDYFDNQ